MMPEHKPDKVAEAWSLIEKCITPSGILASAQKKDNYKRIWSRDAMITGITGVLCNNNKVMDGLKNSILTLKKYQSDTGQIPSNVGLEKNTHISYGSLAGRVDATTWWIIGSCIYSIKTSDKKFSADNRASVTNALKLLKAWEFNGRGLMFVPPGGNWADEYVSYGYTLYDQLLRLWALRLVAEVYADKVAGKKATELKKIIQNNYISGNITKDKYHQTGYSKSEAKKKPYLISSFSPLGYDDRWDMPANALALMLGVNTNPLALEKYLKSLARKNGHWMLPVFYPVIQKESSEWIALRNNHTFQFKNEPYHFMNGGSWPVFLGMLALGLSMNEIKNPAKKMMNALSSLLEKENPLFCFHEYWSTYQLEAGGATQLCFTASGYILLNEAVNLKNRNIFQKYFLW